MKLFTRIISVLAATAVLAMSGTAFAASAAKIDEGVNEALETFRKDVDGSGEFLSAAKGYLVFPRVIKVGVGVGGEGGEGALRVGGQTVDYYNTFAGSVGFQLGAQAKSIIIAFMSQQALDDFRNSSGWKVGVDGSVAIIDVGAESTDHSRTNGTGSETGRVDIFRLEDGLIVEHWDNAEPCPPDDELVNSGKF